MVMAIRRGREVALINNDINTVEIMSGENGSGGFIYCMV